MTAVAIPSDRHRSPVAGPATIGQATAVEQARAVAEVQAAVVVAQQCPRDIYRAEVDMRDSCGRVALANRAFYSVPNRGQGPSVHLARELARVWGNVQYGVHELRRDDVAGESEVQAYAWDVQTNTRSVRTFVVPHQRMKGKQRQTLTDLGDVYLNNQNVGARAVRECIFTVLPDWFTETAQELCRATLEAGDGKPLAERVDNMVRGFAGINVTLAQLETRLRKPRDQWSSQDVAGMGVVFTSIRSGDTTVDEEFAPSRVTTDEIRGSGPAEPSAAARSGMSDNQRRKMHALFGELGIADRGERLAVTSQVVDRRVTSSTELTSAEATVLLETLDSFAGDGARVRVIYELDGAS